MPKRLQQKRTKGWRKPASAVVVSRPSKWGNPFHIDADHDRVTVVSMFRKWIMGSDPAAIKMRGDIEELRGKDLLCFCPVPGPCHGDVLLELANAPDRDEGLAMTFQEFVKAVASDGPESLAPATAIRWTDADKNLTDLPRIKISTEEMKRVAELAAKATIGSELAALGDLTLEDVVSCKSDRDRAVLRLVREIQDGIESGESVGASVERLFRKYQGTRVSMSALAAAATIWMQSRIEKAAE